MAKILKLAAGAVGGFVVLALGFDLYVAVAQPGLGPGHCDLHTTDADGTEHRDRLALFEDGETLWVQSGHHFRGWYHRAVAEPRVQLDCGDGLEPYTAVALETPEAKAHMHELIRRRVGRFGAVAIRVLLLGADVKPVRLDPRQPPISGTRQSLDPAMPLP
jgi:hypothetical protein